MITRDDTVGDARDVFWSKLDTGGSTCPVCDRPGKRYKRPLNHSMVKPLIWLAAFYPAWVNIPSLGPRWMHTTHQYSNSKYWGLIERAENTNPKIKDSGTYRITPLGLDFINGDVLVPKYAYLYNDECSGFEGPWWSVTDALGEYFDYEKLMSGDYGDDQ